MEPVDVRVAETTSSPPDNLLIRRRFGSRLSGEGIEIGPGHVPFPVPASVSVRYVDRWSPAANSSLFPELGDRPAFPDPHVVANLDVDRLAPIPERSQDFVIASHVLEHLANPLAMFVEIHRVLRQGGLLVLLLPDRHKTFDRNRAPTPLSHVIDEYHRDVREVDDDHIVDFLLGTQATSEGEQDFPRGFPPEVLDLHRRRSVHAHVWDADEFAKVIAYAETDLGIRWEVLDTMTSGADGTYGDEFGWLLSKGDAEGLGRARFLRRIWRSARRN
jgi:SAM-dependent methyltransferase